jgi:hypothetical protein
LARKKSSKGVEKIKKPRANGPALRRCHPIAANDLSIKTARASNNYFAGGVSAGLSVVAGGAEVAGFAAGFFSAQPATANAVTSSVNANSFFMPWSPET